MPGDGQNASGIEFSRKVAHDKDWRLAGFSQCVAVHVVVEDYFPDDQHFKLANTIEVRDDFRGAVLGTELPQILLNLGRIHRHETIQEVGGAVGNTLGGLELTSNGIY